MLIETRSRIALHTSTHDFEARDQIDWNPEWSRRARGFPTYAALRQLGRHGVAELIERCCLHASALVSKIGGLPGAEILAKPIINQGVLRFLDLRPSACEEDHGRKTDDVIAAVNASGEAFFTGSTLARPPSHARECLQLAHKRGSRRQSGECISQGSGLSKVSPSPNNPIIGGGAWTRTTDLRIMSQFPDSENKGNPAIPSADRGKVLQNPHPTRTKKGGCE